MNRSEWGTPLLKPRCPSPGSRGKCLSERGVFWTKGRNLTGTKGSRLYVTDTHESGLNILSVPCREKGSQPQLSEQISTVSTMRQKNLAKEKCKNLHDLQRTPQNSSLRPLRFREAKQLAGQPRRFQQSKPKTTGAWMEQDSASWWHIRFVTLVTEREVTYAHGPSTSRDSSQGKRGKRLVVLPKRIRFQVKKIGNVQTKSDQVKHEMTALRVDLHPTQLVIRSDKTWETPKNGSSKMYLSSFVQPKPTQAFEMLEHCRGTEQRHQDTWSGTPMSHQSTLPKQAATEHKSCRASHPSRLLSRPPMSTTFINNILLHHIGKHIGKHIQ